MQSPQVGLLGAGQGKWTATPEGQIEYSAHTDVRRANVGKSTDPHSLKITLSLLVIYVATLSARTT